MGCFGLVGWLVVVEVVAELLLDYHVLQLKGDVEYHRVVVLPVDDQVHVESLVARLVVGEDRQMDGWLRLAGWLEPDHQQVVVSAKNLVFPPFVVATEDSGADCNYTPLSYVLYYNLPSPH